MVGGSGLEYGARLYAAIDPQQTRRTAGGARVPRPLLVTRTATVDDIPALLGLWQELRGVGARAERAVNPVSTTTDLAGRLVEVIKGEECRIVLALAGDEPAGMAVFRPIQPDPLSDSRVLQMSHLIVSDAFRRRGVGRALISAGADIAEDALIEHVGVGLYPSLRDASRFYARLGFAQVLVQRVAPLPVLRRRLAGDHPMLRVEDVVRRRTRMRRPVPAQRAVRRSRTPID